MSDLISRQAILKHIEKIRQSVQMMDDTRRASIAMNGMHLCEEAVRNQPSVQPEIIRCKDCKYMIDTGDDLMCDNAKGWVVATASDFGCVLAERRTDD